MEEIAITKFKADCVAILDRINETGETVRVTRSGKPVAEIGPAKAPKKRRIGAMAGTARITGDIISPIIDPKDVNALNE